MPLQLRPTFDLSTTLAPVQVVSGLEAVLAQQPLDVRWSRPAGTAQRRDFERTHLLIAPSARHFWSPWLHLDIDQVPAGTQIHGRFSPHSSVWTAFAASYLGLGSLGVFSSIFGLSQWMVDSRPWALVGTATCIAIASVLWWASQVGQRLARDEMLMIRSVVDSAMHAAVLQGLLPDGDS